MKPPRHPDLVVPNQTVGLGASVPDKYTVCPVARVFAVDMEKARWRAAYTHSTWLSGTCPPPPRRVPALSHSAREAVEFTPDPPGVCSTPRTPSEPPLQRNLRAEFGRPRPRLSVDDVPPLAVERQRRRRRT